MSINITVHGNQLACARDANCFKDLQTLRKEMFAKKRLQRIVQVREQSKDIASRLRRRVHHEEEKQLEQVRRTKENELKSWKERHVKKLKDHYESRLKTFGEAHLNAEREKQAEKLEKKDANKAATAKKSEKTATLKLKDCRFKTLPKLRVNIPASPKKNVATQADLQVQAHVPEQKAEEKPAPPPSHRPSTLFVDSSTDDSVFNFQPIRPTSYNPANYAGDTTSESTAVEPSPPIVAAVEEPERSERPFTQVSDFLKRRQRERQLEDLASASTALKPNVIISPTKSAPPRPLIPKSPQKGKENFSQRTLESAAKTATSVSTRPTVKYYDHSNRFNKEYKMPSNLVTRSGPEPKDAYEAAVDLKRIERLEVAAEQKKRSQHRPELALEKEKIRKDYEALTQELAAITREENKIKAQTGPPITVTIGKARQQAREREQNLNEAVENVLRKHVPITCSKVAPTSNVKGRQKPGELNVAAKGVTNRPQPAPIVYTSDSSESIQSIVLGRVEKPEPDRYAELMAKVQQQKRLLDQQPMASVPELGFEHLLTALKDMETKPAEKSEGERLLEQRERELREREAKLAEQTKAFFDAKDAKAAQKKKVGPVELQANRKLLEKCFKTATDSSDSSSLLQSTSDCPVQIIIKVNKPVKRHKRKQPKPVKFVDTLTKPGKVYPKTPRPKPKRPESATKAVEAEKTVATSPMPSKPLRPKPKWLQSPAKVADAEKSAENSPESSLATTSASTAYRSPPPRLKTQLDEFFKRPTTPKKPDPVAPKPKSPKPKSKTPAAKLKTPEPVRKTPVPRPKSPKTNAKTGGGRELNPFLVHYINKLLSMSRNSIDNLGVSSSDVPTPGDSVVNVSDNVSQPSEMDEARYKKLQKFIDDNYNFLDEIDETLSRNGTAASLNGTCEENIEKVEKVWAQVLERKEKAMQQPPPKVVMEKLKPALKSRPKSPPPKRVRESFPPTKEKPQPRRTSTPEATAAAQPSVKPILKMPASKPQQMEEELLAKYATLTENCSKRIADLAEMINKVREEKQKLLQTSLSSGGTIPSHGGRPGSTEYLDFAFKTGSPLSADLSKATNADDQPSEEITNILKSPSHLRQMGVSKDSGISMLSRPVTATDFRESPKTIATFEPLLKDIPRITTESKAAAAVLDLQAGSGRKLPRPPATLARFSPQLEPEKPVVPHELSTILEIDTPATSRFSFNQSQETSKPDQLVVSTDKNTLRLELTTPSGDQLTVENFKSLEDYSRLLNLELAAVHEKLELHLDVRPQVNVSTDVLEPRKFEDIGVQAGVDTSSSSGSLPDVVAELKARNLPHNFETSKVTFEKTTGELSVRTFAEPDVGDDLDSLEKDLGKMGLQWAAAMVKKTKESQTLVSTSSNSSPVLDNSGKNASKESANISRPGHPLNLREFLTRELMIRTHSDSNSLSDDSSLSSQFLKSLLSLNTLGSPSTSATISGGPQTPIFQQAMSDKVTPHRTSTPVTQLKTTGGQMTAAADQLTNLNASNDLFSGESRLSSVKKGERSASSTTTTTTTTSSDISISSNKLNLFGLAKEKNKNSSVTK